MDVMQNPRHSQGRAEKLKKAQEASEQSSDHANNLQSQVKEALRYQKEQSEQHEKERQMLRDWQTTPRYRRGRFPKELRHRAQAMDEQREPGPEPFADRDTAYRKYAMAQANTFRKVMKGPVLLKRIMGLPTGDGEDRAHEDHTLFQLANREKAFRDGGETALSPRTRHKMHGDDEQVAA